MDGGTLSLIEVETIQCDMTTLPVCFASLRTCLSHSLFCKMSDEYHANTIHNGPYNHPSLAGYTAKHGK